MLLKATIYLFAIGCFFWSVVPTLRSYSKGAHIRAMYKFFFIWLLTTLPVLLSIAFAPSKSLSWSYVLEMSGSPFSMSEQLVYASAFLAPVLFVFVEAIKSFIEDKDDGRARRFKHMMKTYHRVLLPSILLMIVSVLIYSGMKTDNDRFADTEIFDLFGNKAVIIYLASLVYWYCVLVIDGADEADYVTTSDRNTRDFTADLRRRLGGGK